MPETLPSAPLIDDCACLKTTTYIVIAPIVIAPSIVDSAIHRYMP